MITVRRSEDRGRTELDWLSSRHTFSFGHYHDPDHLGVSALRVINDDRVKPGAGFGTHGHRDMEIISYVLEGTLAHRDSEGNAAYLPAGEFQLMSAGSGITHSEFNGSDSHPLHFLQIWIKPAVHGEPPDYQQKNFGEDAGLTLIASADGAERSLKLKQDANLYQLVLPAGEELELPLSDERDYYIHVIDGAIAVGEESLSAGDGAQLEFPGGVRLVAQDATVRMLVFDLP